MPGFSTCCNEERVAVDGLLQRTCNLVWRACNCYKAGARNLNFELLSRNVDQPRPSIKSAFWLVDEWVRSAFTHFKVLPTGPCGLLPCRGLDVVVEANAATSSTRCSMQKYLRTSGSTVENYGYYKGSGPQTDITTPHLHEIDPVKQHP